MNNWIRSSSASLNKKADSIFTGIFFTLVILRIYLITGIPKLLIYGPHDDLFFAKAAHYIIHGEWMGPYNQLTLIKTPFYSFFMILSFFTGLPLFLNETFFYIGACIVLYYAFTPLIENRWWRLLLFAFISYCPVSLATVWNLRVYREFVYLSLTLYIISFSIGLFLRLDQKISQLLLWSIGLGLSMGAFMITREEGVWIYPALFLLLITCLIFIYQGKMDQKIQRSLLILMPILLWYIPGFIVSSLNYSHYGFRGTTENLDPDYNRVISTLGRIETVGSWHPAIQIHHDLLIKAYEASPLLNELKDPIEQGILIWQKYDDLAMSSKPEWYLIQYGNGGSEISNDRYGWILRVAVYNRGYYASGKYPYDFYKQLADQLELACDNGSLDCSSSQGIPVIGALDQRHFPIIFRMFHENMLHLLNQDYTSIASLNFTIWENLPKSSSAYKYFEEFVYNHIDSLENRREREARYIVDGRADLRLKILQYKEKIMIYIADIYKKFTLPAFIISFVIWVFSIILLISKKQIEHQMKYLVISLFLLGLLFSRVMLLTLIDVTTSVAGMGYSGSSYLFIYVFTFLMLYWMLQRITITLQGTRTTS